MLGWRILACGFATLAAATGTFAQAPSPVAGGAHIDVSRLPVTSEQLADFPFLSWPEEFQPQNPPVNQEQGHFYFWDGWKLNEVEGQTFLVTLIGQGGSHFNEFLLKKTVRDQLKNEGAVKLTESKIPQGVIMTIPEVDRQSLDAGLGDVYNDPVQTWVIKRARQVIWVQYTDSSAGASLAVVASSDPE